MSSNGSNGLQNHLKSPFLCHFKYWDSEPFKRGQKELLIEKVCQMESVHHVHDHLHRAARQTSSCCDEIHHAHNNSRSESHFFFIFSQIPLSFCILFVFTFCSIIHTLTWFLTILHLNLLEFLPKNDVMTTVITTPNLNY